MNQEKISEEDLNFVTKGNVSKETYKEFVNVTYRNNVLLRMLLVVCFILICIGIWSVAHRVWEYVLLCVAAIIVFSLAVVLTRNYTINMSVRKIRELYGTDAMEFVTGFTDEVAYSENKTAGSYAGIKYADIKGLYKTKRFIFLITRGGQSFTVFRNCLSGEEENELLMFLKEKGIGKKK